MVGGCIKMHNLRNATSWPSRSMRKFYMYVATLFGRIRYIQQRASDVCDSPRILLGLVQVEKL